MKVIVFFIDEKFNAFKATIRTKTLTKNNRFPFNPSKNPYNELASAMLSLKPRLELLLSQQEADAVAVVVVAHVARILPAMRVVRLS